MSKQNELFSTAPYTDWAKVYRAASVVDRAIVDWVREHPGATMRDIATGLRIDPSTLSFRLWELAGRSSGPYRADGLLIGTKSGPPLEQVWRYTAREW